MALYYFHLRDGIDVLLDEEGRELDKKAIESAALIEARSIISDDAREGRIRLDQRLDIEDAAHVIVYSLAFVDAVHIVEPHD
jgi:hypothetical protein